MQNLLLEHTLTCGRLQLSARSMAQKDTVSIGSALASRGRATATVTCRLKAALLEAVAEGDRVEQPAQPSAMESTNVHLVHL